MSEATTRENTTGQRASERRTIQRVTASASTLLLVAILVMVNYLAFRHYKRFDWTTQGIYTLSPKSNAVLRDLDQDTDIYMFLSRGESSFLSTDELLKRYAASSSVVHVHYVDPDREASQFKLLAQRFGVGAVALESGEARADVAAVVALGEKNWHIQRDDLVSADMAMPGMPPSAGNEVQLKGEQALTGAIVQVTSGRATKVCATQGHGEWALEQGAERSLGALKTSLRHDNLEWQPLDTLGQTKVPAACDAVLVVGPLRAFSGPESKMLFEYLHAGGSLFMALDPVIERDQIASTGFETQLRELGIRVDSSLVVELDKDRLLTRNVAEFIVTEFGDHPATRSMQHVGRVFMTLARSVTPIGEGGDVEVLMRASDKSFGKINISEVAADSEPTRSASDIEGPVDLAVATQLKESTDKSRPRGGRLVVVGDSDFLTDSLLQAPELDNFRTASALIGWVAQRPALIEIPPKKIKSGNVMLSQEDLWALVFRVAVLMPAAALVLGLAVWFNRRS